MLLSCVLEKVLPLVHTGWWFIDLPGESFMKRVNINQFYDFGSVVHPLTELTPGKPLKEYMFTVAYARAWLNRFMLGAMIPMTICKPAAERTINAINDLMPPDPEEEKKLDTEKQVNYAQLYDIIEGAKNFETVFSAELQNMATYFISKKGIFDTNDLIEHADELFTENIRPHISNQVKHDIREAGKCLAFDLSTAAGFHITRAVEGVLLAYLKLLCPKIIEDLKESQRNLGNYIKLARENKGDEKVCSSLDQFRDLHRNPLIHPETVLTIEDAITLLGIAQSSIVAIITDIIKRKGGSSSNLALVGNVS